MTFSNYISSDFIIYSKKCNKSTHRILENLMINCSDPTKIRIPVFLLEIVLVLVLIINVKNFRFLFAFIN